MQRDPDLVRRALPILGAISDHYFRTEVHGIDNLRTSASLITSTHNGGMVPPDLLGLWVAFFRHFGPEAPIYSLTHAIAFHIPFYGQLATGLIGAVPASPKNARRVLRSDCPLLVCPGGDEDSLKPFSQRHTITFGERRGFIRMAIAEQVPIIPVVSVGAHETMFVINDGRRLAQWLRFPLWLRVKTVPLAVGLPWGLTIAGLGLLPLPTKVVVRVLPPIELAEPPSAAKSRRVVERCFNHVRERMQRALDEMASKRRHAVLG
jgi:1-acyl-sn-glycerol-3-phosphate acyltransferase